MSHWLAERVSGREQWLVAALALGTLSSLAMRHQYLTIGTVENDFVVLSRLAESIAAAVQVHGLFPIGYPLLLFAVSNLFGNLFLAAKVITVVSTVASSLVIYLIASTLFGHRVGVLCQLLTVVNWYYVESGLLVGTDAPWLLAQLSVLLMVLRATRTGQERHVLLAGFLQGLAYLIRYQSLMGMVAIPLFLVLFKPIPGGRARNVRSAVAFVALCLAVASPQLVLSTLQHGQPLYNQEARNVWFGLNRSVLGEFEFWRENQIGDVRLFDLIIRDPGAFFVHWVVELAKFWMRALGGVSGLFPEIIRASAGGQRWAYIISLLLGWLGIGGWAATRWGGTPSIRRAVSVPQGALLLPFFVASYSAGVALALVLTRYVFVAVFLALVFVARFLADGSRTIGRSKSRYGGTALALGLAALLIADALVANFTLVAKEMRVLEARTLLEQARASTEDKVLSLATGGYALQLSYRFVSPGRPILSQSDLRNTLRDQGATFFLYDEMVPDRSDLSVQRIMTSNPTPSFLEPLGTTRSRGLAMTLYRVRADALLQN